MEPDKICKDFGQEIRRRREALGFTLEELAARAGLTPNYIGTVELGKRDPSLSTVVALSQGLAIETGELFGMVMNLSPAASEAGRLFDQVSQAIQEGVLIILREGASRVRRAVGAKEKGKRVEKR
jgi:transcriptional regulator with XRE-family HTH domain